MNKEVWNDLRNAVVLQAVSDYTRLIKFCKRKKIKDPKKYLKFISRYSPDNASTSSIIREGIDAEQFLLNKNTTTLFTDIDGQKIINHIRETA